METNSLAEKEIKEVLNKYGLELGFKLSFPVYNILPDEVKLALRIVAKYGMRITLDLQAKNK